MVTIQIATSSISVLYMRSWLLNIVVYHLFLKKKVSNILVSLLISDS